jgi:DNA-binding response OmpR family regulator
MQKRLRSEGLPASSHSADDATADLHRRYLARLEEKHAVLTDCVFPLTPERRLWLLEEVHSLAGSGGSFGYWPITRTAQKLETLLREHPDTGDGELMAGLAQLAGAVINAVRNPVQTNTQSDIGAYQPPRANPRVVIIDDDDIVRDLLSKMIGEGADVLTAADITTGRQLIEALEPDLVLLDNHIGAENAGIDLLEALQASPLTQGIPVIMITASHDAEEVMRALMAGAADYIVKPFDPVETGRRIRNRLDRLDSHVLIADDDDTVRDMLVHKFQGAGCRVTAVNSGAEAWQALQEGDFAVALLDRMMPGMDGMTLLRMMKANPRTRAVPVVFLTARHYGADVIEGLNSGAVDYITKPFNADEVLTRVVRLLKSETAQ